MIKALLKILCTCIAVVAIVVGATNALVVLTTEDDIVSVDEASGYQADAIVVLGASVFADGTPSTILQDRLDCGIALYKAGAAPKIIMSGDNSTEHYNECAAMKRYAIAQGVPSEDIFCDHAGFSTYESMYRAKNVFGCSRVVVATQTYHLYRALYSAHALGGRCNRRSERLSQLRQADLVRCARDSRPHQGLLQGALRCALDVCGRADLARPIGRCDRVAAGKRSSRGMREPTARRP